MIAITQKVCYNMTENIISSSIGAFVGAILGFFMAWLLFYITESCKQKKLHERLIKDALKELKANNSYLANIADALGNYPGNVTAEQTKELNAYFCLNKNLHVILDLAYKEGCVHRMLTEEADMELFVNVLNSLHSGSTYWIETPHSWISGNMTPAERQRIAPIEKEKVDKLLEDMKLLKSKFPKKEKKRDRFKKG